MMLCCEEKAPCAAQQKAEGEMSLNLDILNILIFFRRDCLLTGIKRGYIVRINMNMLSK